MKPTPFQIRTTFTENPLVEQLGVDEAQVTPDATIESLGSHSLDQVELVMAVELEYPIDITDEDAVKLITVQDLRLTYIEANVE